MFIKEKIDRLFIVAINKLLKKNYLCILCNKKINDFEKLPQYYYDNLAKYNYIHPVFAGETINYLQYSCPFCFGADRERLYALFLEKYFNEVENKENFKFLDFAPSKSLSNWIRKYKWVKYRTIDLYMQGVDDKADITNLDIYTDNEFDFILCSHVLEHIENEKKAISELYRILKPTGKAIIMVPILTTLKEDFENPEHKTEAERWKYYGQNDHVRKHSKKGFVKKLENAGFKVEQLNIDYFSKEEFEKNAISKKSVLYVVSK